MRTVTFIMEEGMYYAIFTDGASTWKYFVPWGEIIPTLILTWIEHGTLPQNAKRYTKS